jgi:hypothetical protein
LAMKKQCLQRMRRQSPARRASRDRSVCGFPHVGEIAKRRMHHSGVALASSDCKKNRTDSGQ